MTLTSTRTAQPVDASRRGVIILFIAALVGAVALMVSLFGGASADATGTVERVDAQLAEIARQEAASIQVVCQAAADGVPARLIATMFAKHIGADPAAVRPRIDAALATC